MARMSDWQREAHEAVRREPWALRGMNAVVKVVPSGDLALPARGGYITVGKSLLNKTPEQMIVDLGLNAKRFVNGATIYRFSRLPQASEYEYELTAKFPNGLAYTALSDRSYPAGSPKIHQWKIKEGVQIPVDLKTFLDLKPGKIFPWSWL